MKRVKIYRHQPPRRSSPVDIRMRFIYTLIAILVAGMTVAIVALSALHHQ